MKKLLLSILFAASILLLKAQEVKFISVNSADTSLENITFKKLPRLLAKDSLTAGTLATPAKWMVKLNKKLSRQQRRDSNIYIFFCHNIQDSITAFLPLSGKCGYVLLDTSKTGSGELERLQQRLRMHKYQWDLIHDPEAMIALFQDEEEGEMKRKVLVDWIDGALKDDPSKTTTKEEVEGKVNSLSNEIKKSICLLGGLTLNNDGYMPMHHFYRAANFSLAEYYNEVSSVLDFDIYIHY